MYVYTMIVFGRMAATCGWSIDQPHVIYILLTREIYEEVLALHKASSKEVAQIQDARAGRPACTIRFSDVSAVHAGKVAGTVEEFA